VELDKRALAQAHHLIGSCSLFAGLSPGERNAISERARVRAIRAGETVFSIGSHGSQMMAVLTGTVRISVPSASGKELLLARIQPGEIFGELSLLDGKERSADAVAETPCTLALLDRRDVLSFFERNPSAWPKLVEVICQRLRNTDQILAEVALLQLPTRLAKTLLRVLPPTDSVAAAAKTKLSQRDLANMVGGARESVNKCMRRWQSMGTVRISGGSIWITNRQTLEAIAEQN
jgi:CRP-like cAMP-binding protein